MVNATWPTDLPRYLLVAGFDRRFRKNKIRTQMEYGPVKQRRRGTSTPAPIKGAIQLTAAQVATLEAFHETTLVDGTLPFDWVEPIRQTAVTYRFVGEPAVTGGPVIFRATLDLEIMP